MHLSLKYLGKITDPKDLVTKEYVDNKQDKVLTLSLSTSWSGANPYTQTATLSGYTTTLHTKVDLQPNATVISQLINDGVEALYIENNNGTLTAYAVGAAPTTSLTLQVTVTEVAG